MCKNCKLKELFDKYEVDSYEELVDAIERKIANLEERLKEAEKKDLI